MMKIWFGSISAASAVSASVTSMAYMVIAPTRAEAIENGMALGLKEYPVSDGWTYHKVKVNEVPPAFKYAETRYELRLEQV